MDPEIPELGSGLEPADCLIWGTSHGISVKKTGMATFENPAIPALFHRHLYYCQNNPSLFRRPGVGRAHGKGNNKMPVCHIKKQKKCIGFV